MNESQITVLVHGDSESVEAIRARGITGLYPPERLRLLFREGTRRATSRRWRADLRAHPPQLLYVVNTALPGSLIALRSHWLQRIPFVLDTGDAVYEMAKRSGINAGARLPLLRVVEDLAQRNAHAVVVRGSRHQAFLLERGVQRVELIRDGYMPHPASGAEEVADLRARLGLGDSFVVGVMGSLTYSPRLEICYGWDLVRALAALRDLDLRGLIVGDGDGRAWLEGQARMLGVAERVVFTGRVPYHEVPAYLQLMDVALSTQTNNLPGQVRTTGKLPEYMAAARFVLASRVGEAALILPESMLVDFDGEVDVAYPRKIAERVRSLTRDPQLLDARLALPALAQDLFSYPILSARFNDLIGSL